MPCISIAGHEVNFRTYRAEQCPQLRMRSAKANEQSCDMRQAVYCHLLGFPKLSNWIQKYYIRSIFQDISPRNIKLASLRGERTDYSAGTGTSARSLGRTGVPTGSSATIILILALNCRYRIEKIHQRGRMRWICLFGLALLSRTPALGAEPSSQQPLQAFEHGKLNADWLSLKLKAAARGAGHVESLNEADTAELRHFHRTRVVSSQNSRAPFLSELIFAQP